jgi:malonyl-CoA decarboxylase
MLDELRKATARARGEKLLRGVITGCKRLLSERGQANGMAIARTLAERITELEGWQLDAFFDYLAHDLRPDPKAVLRAAEAYAAQPDASALIALTRVAEPLRQELLRRLNRAPGGTECILHLRRALLQRLSKKPELRALEADFLHLLSSWFNPGFLKMQRVDWNSPAALLERIIHHEAVHAIDGWDDLRRRLQPDRRCFAFFHPQLPGEPLIFVEVALVPDIPAAIAPLIDKSSTPSLMDKFRVACFYSISNCEPGLRGVSLGNFLIKSVAEQLQRELPRLRTFCTLSPVPGFAAWLQGNPDFAQVPGAKPKQTTEWEAARQTLLAACEGDLARLQHAPAVQALDEKPTAALCTLASTYLLMLSPTPKGDPVARFHLDNGARLERLNPRGDLSTKGCRQSFGLMVNYLYDLEKIEASHEKFVGGEVARSRAVQAQL